MRLRLLRHATLVLEYAGRRLLVDPTFAAASAFPPIGNAASTARWPLVPLPIDDAALTQLCTGLDGVLVTHTHGDHWDAAAIAALPKALPLVIQPPDAAKIGGQGFTALTPVETSVEWQGLRLTRTGGQHGRGDLAVRLAPVSGFVLQHADEPTLYIAGDTVWCDEVRDAITMYRPDVIVVNAGAAQFLQGGVITMDVPDLREVATAAPQAAIVAVHFETVNHCLLTRAACASALREAGLARRVKLPADGEVLAWTAQDGPSRR